jgi:hypothetical protein
LKIGLRLSVFGAGESINTSTNEFTGAHMSSTSKKNKVKSAVKADAKKLEGGVKQGGKDVEKAVGKGASELKSLGGKIKKKA